MLIEFFIKYIFRKTFLSHFMFFLRVCMNNLSGGMGGGGVNMDIDASPRVERGDGVIF